MIHQCFGLLAQGLAPSTRRVYAAGQRAYFQFCSSFSLPYFPSSEWLLMLFATWLAQTRKLAPSSVSSYIAAIRSWHIDLGAPDSTSGATRLARLLRGIRRSRTSPAFIRLPITNRLMLVLQSALAVPLFDHFMFWAACCTAFFGFLRVSEFTCSGVFVPGRHLGFDDIDWDAAGHYRLFLHTSKTDARLVARFYLVLLVIRFVPLRLCLGILPSVDPLRVRCLSVRMVHRFRLPW